jgi:aminopeptidase 2
MFVLQSLFVPLVEKLGYDFPEGEDLEITLLRKIAVGSASGGNDPK